MTNTTKSQHNLSKTSKISKLLWNPDIDFFFFPQCFDDTWINSAKLVFPCENWFYLGYEVTIKTVASKLDTYNHFADRVQIDIFQSDDFVFHHCAQLMDCSVDLHMSVLLMILVWR